VKSLYIALAVCALVAVRIFMFVRKRRARAATASAAGSSPAGSDAGGAGYFGRWTRVWASPDRLGDVGEIAMREIKERLRGRIFRIGTLLILILVALAIIIPKLSSRGGGGGPTVQTVGVLGGLSPAAKQVVEAAAATANDKVTFSPESSLAATKTALGKGKLDVAIIDGHEVLLYEPAALASSPADPTFVQNLAAYLGLLSAYRTARLTPAQAATVTRTAPVPVRTMKSGSASAPKSPSVAGLVLLFVMLTQYCTWILIGVMQEKSSRVVEVLLATVRPIQLLGGKVLGIGLVALGQAALVVGFALVVGKAAGSDLLHGTAPLVLLCELLWLVLGYAFYCWLYAAAGSIAERQDQVQTLALPLSIPIILGYVFSLTVASSGHSDVFFKILAYVPFTAPFCMSVLVGLSQVTWWQFVGSVLITIAGTAGMAIFAARIYRRAVLHTGARVHLRELLARGQRRGPRQLSPVSDDAAQ
jgi:ABC-2 type transport system permease protein